MKYGCAILKTEQAKSGCRCRRSSVSDGWVGKTLRDFLEGFFPPPPSFIVIYRKTFLKILPRVSSFKECSFSSHSILILILKDFTAPKAVSFSVVG